MDALDFDRLDHRERAAWLSAGRIRASLEATLATQEHPALTNYRRGFFLVYINSFNEWHEGHAFEPMKDGVELSPGECAFGYRNPRLGDYRLTILSEEIRRLLVPPSLEGGRRASHSFVRASAS